MLPEPSGREAAAPRRRFSGSWESLGTLGDLGPKLRMDGGEIIAEMHAQYYATPKVGATIPPAAIPKAGRPIRQEQA
jgi:hypothetical protein